MSGEKQTVVNLIQGVECDASTNDNENENVNERDTVYCEQNCKFERKDKKAGRQLDMIECSICRTWYHNECVGLRKDAQLVVWPCPQCCNIYQVLANINKNLDSNKRLIESLISEKNMLNTSLDRAHKDIDLKQSELDSMKGTITRLESRITKLESEIEVKTKEACRNGHSLVIGDSLFRDVDEGKLVRTRVKAISGAKVEDVARHLSEEGSSYETPLNKLYVCVGTNNCSSSDVDMESVKKSYKDMVESMKQLVSSPNDIIISSVPPRCDNNNHQGRIETLNAVLTTVAQDTGATFVDNDGSFKLTDGSINDGYLLPVDGVHLSKQGTNRLLKNMKVLFKHDHRCDATKTGNRRKKNDINREKPKNSQPSHSNSQHEAAAKDEGDDLDLDHPFWRFTRRPKPRPSHPPRHYRNHQDHPGQRYKDHQGQHRSTQRGSRCEYCCEYNHSTSACGFRKPVECRQCMQLGHKQKFCAEMSNH